MLPEHIKEGMLQVLSCVVVMAATIIILALVRVL